MIIFTLAKIAGSEVQEQVPNNTIKEINTVMRQLESEQDGEKWGGWGGRGWHLDVVRCTESDRDIVIKDKWGQGDTGERLLQVICFLLNIFINIKWLFYFGKMKGTSAAAACAHKSRDSPEQRAAAELARAFSERRLPDGLRLRLSHRDWLSICIICFLYYTFPHLERNPRNLIRSVTQLPSSLLYCALCNRYCQKKNPPLLLYCLDRVVWGSLYNPLVERPTPRAP